jgi:hypothetical protein
MKLRIRSNTLRLRLNQKEVEALSAGEVIKEKIDFPGSTALSYILTTAPSGEAQLSFENGTIHITAPRVPLMNWVSSDEVGIYFTLQTGEKPLKISIEKDLACIDGPEEERDPHAFPRELSEKVC